MAKEVLEQIKKAENLKTSMPYADIRNICGKTSLLELHEFFKTTDLLINIENF